MNRIRVWDLDWKLLVPTSILVLISQITLLSINFSLFKTQLFFLVFSFIIFLFFSFTNFKALRTYSVGIYLTSLLLLFLVLILGIESRGSIRWIEFLGFRAQFSEILKPVLAISFSAYLANVKNFSLKGLFRIFAFLVPVVFFIFLQPDLGNDLIYIIVTVLVLICIGFPIRYFLVGGAFLLGFLPLFWNFLHEYQKQRIITFLNPSSDPLGTSYNAIQAIITVGSGMILGKGLGQGTQSGLSFLPEQHTDFIFATISEQLGFIGSALVLVAFAFLLYRIYSIIRNTDDKFPKFFSIVCFFLILTQLFLNVGMNLGLLPIVGVTLPFVSYGGSSLLSNFILLGLLAAISRSQRKNEVLEIK